MKKPDPKATKATPEELAARIASGYYTASKSARAFAKAALANIERKP